MTCGVDPAIKNKVLLNDSCFNHKVKIYVNYQSGDLDQHAHPESLIKAFADACAFYNMACFYSLFSKGSDQSIHLCRMVRVFHSLTLFTLSIQHHNS